MIKYLLDSSNLNDFNEISKYIKLDGITTNPSILSKQMKNKNDLKEFFLEVKKIENIELHIQTTENKCDKIVEQYDLLHEYFGDKFYIKIPVSSEGLKACKFIKEKKGKVTMTGIFSVGQVIASAKFDADYVAPYINRMDNIGIDPFENLKIMLEVLKGTKTKILAASFKNLSQVNKAIQMGVEIFTLDALLLKQSIDHPYTTISIIKFENDWNLVFGEKKEINSILKEITK